MILPVHDLVRERITTALARQYGLAADALPAIVIDYPPTRALGDLALPRRLRTRPAAAQGAAADRPGNRRRARRRSPASRASRPPNGYLNLFLDRPAFLRRPPRRRHGRRGAGPGAAARSRRSSSTRPSTRTRRRTSATCGTRRSATRSCACCASAASRSRCRTTSTTPASRWPTSSSASASSSSKTSPPRSDAHRRRARGSTTTAGISTRASPTGTRRTRRGSQMRRDTLHDIEHGERRRRPPSARFIADRIVRCHLKTMARLNVQYDLLTWEGDILRLHFWAQGVRDPEGAGHRVPADRRAGWPAAG